MTSFVAILLLLLGAAAPGSIKASATLRGRRTIEDGRSRGDGFTGLGEADATEWEDTVPDDNIMPAPIAFNTELVVVSPATASAKPTPMPTLQNQSNLSVVTPSQVPSPSPRTNQQAGKPSPLHTPKPTMPKLFADAIPESGGFNLCSLPVIDVMCGFDLCNSQMLDDLCVYFGYGDENEIRADAEDVSSGPTASPRQDATVSPRQDATASPRQDATASPSQGASSGPSSSPSHASSGPSSSPSQEPVKYSTRAPTTFSPTGSPTKIPSDSPTKSPSTSPSRSPTSAPTDLLECPVNGWDPYTIPQLESNTSGRIFEYLQESFEETSGTRAYHYFFVKDNCVYAELTSAGAEMLYDAPENWLHAAAVYFGGAALDNGAVFSGTAVPRKNDITVVRSGVDQWSVLIQAASESIVGEKPITWIDLPSEERAEAFRIFLWTILETNPQVLLSNNLNRCGSGPFCWTAGRDACYMDPTTGLLHVDYRMTDGGVETADFTDAIEWFDTCAASLNCFRRNGGGQFLYADEPLISKLDEVFAFTGSKTVSGDPLEWECGNERQSYKLYHFAKAASRDPQSPFAKRAS